MKTVQNKAKDKSKVILSEEERIKIIANLIIDRIIEDYKRGTLRFKQ